VPEVFLHQLKAGRCHMTYTVWVNPMKLVVVDLNLQPVKNLKLFENNLLGCP
jgi:hypothetical protein